MELSVTVRYSKYVIMTSTRKRRLKTSPTMPGQTKNPHFKFAGDQEWCLVVPAPGSLLMPLRAVVPCADRKTVTAVAVREDLSFDTPLHSPPLKRRHQTQRSSEEDLEDAFGTNTGMSSSFSLMRAWEIKKCLVDNKCRIKKKSRNVS